MTKLYCRLYQVSRGWRLYTQLFLPHYSGERVKSFSVWPCFCPHWPPMLAKDKGFFGGNCLPWYQWTEQLDLFTKARLITLIVKVKDKRLDLSLHLDWEVRVTNLSKLQDSLARPVDSVDICSQISSVSGLLSLMLFSWIMTIHEVCYEHIEVLLCPEVVSHATCLSPCATCGDPS